MAMGSHPDIAGKLNVSAPCCASCGGGQSSPDPRKFNDYVQPKSPITAETVSTKAP